MWQNLFRVALIILIGYGLIKANPAIAPAMQNTVQEAAQHPAVKGAVDVINQALPENKKINLNKTPQNTNISSETNQSSQVQGVSTSTPLTKVVTEKITETTTNTIESIKDISSDHMCEIMIKQVQSNCEDYSIEYQKK